MPNDLEDEGQGHPLWDVESNARCIFGANLFLFGWIPADLLC